MSLPFALALAATLRGSAWLRFFLQLSCDGILAGTLLGDATHRSPPKEKQGNINRMLINFRMCGPIPLNKLSKADYNGQNKVSKWSGSHSESIWKAFLLWKPRCLSMLDNFASISKQIHLNKSCFQNVSRPFPSYEILELTIGSCHGFGKTKI